MIIRIETTPSRPTVHLVGRFDAHEAPGFRDAAHPLVSTHATVAVDLSQVAFIDSTALAELVRLQKAAQSLGGEVLLDQPSDAVRVILEITALAGLFTVDGSGRDAP